MEVRRRGNVGFLSAASAGGASDVPGNAPENLARALGAPDQWKPSRKGEKAGVGGGALGQTQPGQQLETAQQQCVRVQTGHSSQTGQTGRAPKPA